MVGVILHRLWIYAQRKLLVFPSEHIMTTELIIKALRNAYHTQRPKEGLMFHSDLGSQYTGDEFANVIKQLNMTHSFSHKGSPYDNDCIEYFHAILKKEEVNHVQYIYERSARLAVFRFIEG